MRHALRAARAWRTEKPTVLLVTETNFWYLLIRLPFLPAKVASFLVEVLACHGAQSRRRRQLADSESGPARGKGAAGAGEARAGGGGQGRVPSWFLVWFGVFAFYIRGPVSKTQPLICVLCFPKHKLRDRAWGCGTHKTSQEECPGSPCSGAPDAATLADACVPAALALVLTACLLALPACAPSAVCSS